MRKLARFESQLPSSLNEPLYDIIIHLFPNFHGF